MADIYANRQLQKGEKISIRDGNVYVSRTTPISTGGGTTTIGSGGGDEWGKGNISGKTRQEIIDEQLRRQGKQDASYTQGGSTYNPATTALETEKPAPKPTQQQTQQKVMASLNQQAFTQQPDYVYTVGNRFTASVKQGSPMQQQLLRESLISPTPSLKTPTYKEATQGRLFGIAQIDYGAMTIGNWLAGKPEQQGIGFYDVAPYKLSGTAPTYNVQNLRAQDFYTPAELKPIQATKLIQSRTSAKAGIITGGLVVSGAVGVPALSAVASSVMVGYGAEKFTTPYGKLEAQRYEKEYGFWGKPLYYGTGALEIVGGVYGLKASSQLYQIQALKRVKPISFTYVTQKQGIQSFGQVSYKQASSPYFISFGTKPVTSQIIKAGGLLDYGQGFYTVEGGTGISTTKFSGLLGGKTSVTTPLKFSGTIKPTTGISVSSSAGIKATKEISSAYSGKLRLTDGEKIIKTRFGGFPLTEGETKVLISGTIPKARVYSSGEFLVTEKGIYNIPKATGILKPAGLGFYREYYKPVEEVKDFYILPPTKRAMVGTIQTMETPTFSYTPSFKTIQTPTTRTYSGELLPLSDMVSTNVKPTLIFKAPTLQTGTTKNILISSTSTKQTSVIKSPTITQIIPSMQTPVIRSFEITKQPQIQMPQQTQIYKTPTISPPTISPVINIPFTPMIPVPYIPSGDFSFGMTTRRFKGKQRKKYTPSFEALVFNIRGKIPKGIETGARVRPIPKGYSFAFKQPKFNFKFK